MMELPINAVDAVIIPLTVVFCIAFYLAGIAMVWGFIGWEEVFRRAEHPGWFFAGIFWPIAVVLYLGGRLGGKLASMAEKKDKMDDLLKRR